MPAEVDKLYKEVKEGNPSYSEEQAWATAWSIFCRNNDSAHCHRDKSEYLKTAADRFEFRVAIDNFLYASLRYAMSRSEALSVLDLHGSPDESEVMSAWKHKILQAHPDRGGDANLAVKLNVARDVLLGKGAYAPDSHRPSRESWSERDRVKREPPPPPPPPEGPTFEEAVQTSGLPSHPTWRFAIWAKTLPDHRTGYLLVSFDDPNGPIRITTVGYKGFGHKREAWDVTTVLKHVPESRRKPAAWKGLFTGMVDGTLDLKRCWTIPEGWRLTEDHLEKVWYWPRLNLASVLAGANLLGGDAASAGPAPDIQFRVEADLNEKKELQAAETAQKVTIPVTAQYVLHENAYVAKFPPGVSAKPGDVALAAYAGSRFKPVTVVLEELVESGPDGSMWSVDKSGESTDWRNWSTPIVTVNGKDFRLSKQSRKALRLFMFGLWSGDDDISRPKNLNRLKGSRMKFDAVDALSTLLKGISGEPAELREAVQAALTAAEAKKK